MPSPDAAAHPVASPVEGLSLTDTVDFADGAQNGAADGHDQVVAAGPVKPAVTQGKPNAKEVPGASTTSIEPTASPSSKNPVPSPSPPVSSSSTPAAGVNGASQGKKRSRSGSIIQSPRPPETLRETPVEKILIDDYLNRENQHAALKATHDPHAELLKEKAAEREYYRRLNQERMVNPGAIFGMGYEGFGNFRTDLRNSRPRLIYPAQRKRPGGRKSKEFRLNKKELAAQSDALEELVPIRLDLEFDKLKLRDTFTWNLNESMVSCEQFAEKLLEDFQLPPEQNTQLARQITQSMQEQLQDYWPHIHTAEEPLDPNLPYTAYRNDEMRILIRLNITIGTQTLVDQFEWEINNPQNSPEEFARQTAADLRLPGEFITAIAHSIREQVQLFTKSLYITGYPFDGRPIDDADLQSAFLPSPLPSLFRPFQAAKDFTPYFYVLNDAELDRTEVSISREQRRQKRSVNRRGGPALPDLKDRQRTIRTQIVSSVLAGAAETLEDSGIFKRTRTGRKGRSAGQRDGGEESDDSDSDDSAPDSPMVQAGTARTRGMRGAASVAQAAMRNNLGRSATPESSSLHEARMARRFIQREESEDDDDSGVADRPRLLRMAA